MGSSTQAQQRGALAFLVLLFNLGLIAVLRLFRERRAVSAAKPRARRRRAVLEAAARQHLSRHCRRPGVNWKRRALWRRSINIVSVAICGFALFRSCGTFDLVLTADQFAFPQSSGRATRARSLSAAGRPASRGRLPTAPSSRSSPSHCRSRWATGHTLARSGFAAAGHPVHDRDHEHSLPSLLVRASSSCFSASPTPTGHRPLHDVSPDHRGFCTAISGPFSDMRCRGITLFAPAGAVESRAAAVGSGLIAAFSFADVRVNDFIVAVAMNSSESARTLPVAIYISWLARMGPPHGGRDDLDHSRHRVVRLFQRYSFPA